MDAIRVTLKAAATLDGKIATRAGHSQWITGEAARKAGHRLRNENDGILVGINTVLADNPRLNTRGVENGKTPISIVLDSTGRTPLEAACLKNQESESILVVGNQCPEARILAFQSAGHRVLISPKAVPEIPWLLAELGKLEIESLLIEGGSQIHASFIKAKLADHLVLFLAGKIFGGTGSLPWCGDLECDLISEAPHLTMQSVEMVGGDLMIRSDFNWENL